MNKVDKEIARIRNERYWGNVKTFMYAIAGGLIVIAFCCFIALFCESAKII